MLGSEWKSTFLAAAGWSAAERRCDHRQCFLGSARCRRFAFNFSDQHRDAHASLGKLLLAFPLHVPGRTMIRADNCWLCSRCLNPQLPRMAFLPERPFRHYTNASSRLLAPRPKTRARLNRFATRRCNRRLTSFESNETLMPASTPVFQHAHFSTQR